MKVTNTDTAALSGASQSIQTTAGSATARNKAAASQKSSDYAQLSSLSGHLKSLTAEGRHAHVESVGAIVASGQYRPDSSAISARIIQQSMSNRAAA